jgi:hypothetical protein
MYNKEKANILLSIFRRKGGEGTYTKILSERYNFINEDLLISGEKQLIGYYKDELNWFLLTDARILTKNEMTLNIILNSNLKKVGIAIQEEFRNRIADKNKFTNLLLTDKNDTNYLVKIEERKPFQGIYQVLHFITM